MHKDDGQLASESMLGNQASFDELVRRYSRPLFHFCYRLTGNAATAEDCAQESFIKAWKNLSSYDTRRGFRQWMFTIARNTTTDHLRRKKALYFSDLSRQDLPFDETVADDGPLPEDLISGLEDKAAAKRLLESLPPESREIVVLHYYEDMTFEEIGSITGRPMNTVKSIHRRAVMRMRDAADAPKPHDETY